MPIDRRQPLLNAKVISDPRRGSNEKSGELLTEQPPFAGRRAEFAGKRQRTVSSAPYREAWQ
jgi:hypothetical protein